MITALLLALVPVQDRQWGPEQATGAPDTLEAGDFPTAWASRAQNGQREWLELTYPEAVEPIAVRVFESFNPGAITRVIAIDGEGQDHVAWEGSDPGHGAERQVVLLPLDVEGEFDRIRLELNASLVRGWNEIDAVGLHDADGGLWWAESATASSTFARGDAQAEARTLPEVAELKVAWATRADGLLDVYRKARGTAFASELAREIVEVQRSAVGPPTFAGSWQSTYGPMRLEQEGSKVTGKYATGTIDGEVNGEGRLIFNYTEADAAGEGWFDLNGNALIGRWRPDGFERWSRWSALRAPETQKQTWLVVIEAPWETALGDTPYAFGEMLESVFDHQPGISVRRRSFTDAESFHGWVRQIEWLDGEVVLSISTHATKEGLQCRDGMITPEEVGKALDGLTNIRLVHFSACEAMAGELPNVVHEALGGSDTYKGVSGYDISVDWMGSALCEFLYFDLVLNRGVEPSKAADQLLKLLAFAGDERPEGTAVPASHFRFEAPKPDHEE